MIWHLYGRLLRYLLRDFSAKRGFVFVPEWGGRLYYRPTVKRSTMVAFHVMLKAKGLTGFNIVLEKTVNSEKGMSITHVKWFLANAMAKKDYRQATVLAEVGQIIIMNLKIRVTK